MSAETIEKLYDLSTEGSLERPWEGEPGVFPDVGRVVGYLYTRFGAEIPSSLKESLIKTSTPKAQERLAKEIDTWNEVAKKGLGVFDQTQVEAAGRFLGALCGSYPFASGEYDQEEWMRRQWRILEVLDSLPGSEVDFGELNERLTGESNIAGLIASLRGDLPF